MIERNTQLMRRAELDGHVSELHDFAANSYGGTHLWYVPVELRPIVGFMAAVVRL